MAEAFMRVKDVMTKDVQVATIDMSLVAAAKVMRGQSIGFLPVVENGYVLGVLTDRDMVVRGIAEGRNVYMATAGDIMTSAVMWCFEDETLVEAAQLMEDNRVRRLLVLDREKRLVGLLSLDDLAARMSSDRLLGTVLRNVTAAA
jgi:CBS domain-containing protein